MGSNQQDRLLLGLLRGELEFNLRAHRNRVVNKSDYAQIAEYTMADLFSRLDNARSQEEFDYAHKAINNFLLYLRQSIVPSDSKHPEGTKKLYELETLLYSFSFDFEQENAGPIIQELTKLANTDIFNIQIKQNIEKLILHFQNRDRIAFNEIGLTLLDQIMSNPDHQELEILRMNYLFDDLKKRVDARVDSTRPALDRVTSKEELALDFLPGFMSTGVGIAGLATALIVFPPSAIAIVIGSFIPPIVDFAMATYAIAKNKPVPTNITSTEKEHEHKTDPSPSKPSFSERIKNSVDHKKVPLLLSAIALGSLTMTIVSTAGLAVLPLAIAGLSLTVGVMLGLGIKHIYQRVKLSNTKDAVEGVVKDTINLCNTMERGVTLDPISDQANRAGRFRQAAREQLSTYTESFDFNRPKVSNSQHISDNSVPTNNYKDVYKEQMSKVTPLENEALGAKFTDTTKPKKN